LRPELHRSAAGSVACAYLTLSPTQLAAASRLSIIYGGVYRPESEYSGRISTIAEGHFYV
jgi:hypothetical protein